MNSVSWQSILSNSSINIQDLLDKIGLKPSDLYAEPMEMSKFPIRASERFINKTQPQKPTDPILLQVLPTKEELISHRGYLADPLLESSVNPCTWFITQVPWASACHPDRGPVLSIVDIAFARILPIKKICHPKIISSISFNIFKRILLFMKLS